MASPKTSETFNYAYSLNETSPGVFKLVDANPGSPGVNPVADGVTLTDQSGIPLLPTTRSKFPTLPAVR